MQLRRLQKKPGSKERRFCERNESRVTLMRRSSARKIERLTEGGLILKSPIELLEVEAKRIKPITQFDRPVERKAGIATCFSLGQFEVHQVIASSMTPRYSNSP